MVNDSSLVIRPEAPAPDSLARQRFLEDSILQAREDSLLAEKLIADSLLRVRALQDSLLRAQMLADSLRLAREDSIERSLARMDSLIVTAYDYRAAYRLDNARMGGKYVSRNGMLYVSTGVGGSVKYRLGAWPAIELITLRRGHAVE